MAMQPLNLRTARSVAAGGTKPREISSQTCSSQCAKTSSQPAGGGLRCMLDIGPPLGERAVQAAPRLIAVTRSRNHAVPEGLVGDATIEPAAEVPVAGAATDHSVFRLCFAAGPAHHHWFHGGQSFQPWKGEK